MNFLLLFRSWMSLSSVRRRSQWFMAAERMRQSIKSFSVFLSLKAKPRTPILLPFTVVWSSEPMLKISTWFRVFSKPNKGNRVQE